MKKIIGVILLCLVIGVGSYFGTLYLDSLKNKGEAKVTVTFEDSETFKLETISKMEKKEALKEWPYIMEVDNSGDAKALYQIIITDIETSTIKRDKLDYSLYLDDSEVVNGKLKDIKDNIIYTHEINGNTKQKYKLYIWVNSEVEKTDNYEYKLEFNTIKAGGPGF